MKQPDHYFDDENKDNIPDGWEDAHRRMLLKDLNKNKIPDDFEPFVDQIVLEVKTVLMAFFFGMALLAVAVLIIEMLIS